MESQNKKLILNQKVLSLPRINLNSRQLCDLELLMNGSFYPLKGFMNEEDYTSVIDKLRLKNNQLFPIPIVLDVSNGKVFKINDEIILCDEYGKPLALMKISSVYRPDKVKEAKLVYNSVDPHHPGVNYLFNQTNDFYLGGSIIQLGDVERFDFNDYRQTPTELKKWFLKNKWTKIIGFQTRNPIHKAHYWLIKNAAKNIGAKVLVHPVVGVTKEGDIDYITRVRCYTELYEEHLKKFAKLSLLPLAMRMAGPREALLHMIIRKNYGCTHFIVGRNHADPGNDKNGKPYFQPYEAQELAKKYEKEIGIIVVPFKELVYDEKKKKYLPFDEIKGSKYIKKISGTEFRRLISTNKKIPSWFSFPEVLTEIRRGIKREAKEGLTIFFTGLPSSGKSTISRILYFRLLEMINKKITLLDGDIVRQNLSKGLGFSRDDRIANIKRIGFVASEITKHQGIAICSAIAPNEEARTYNRRLISSYGHYLEVYISTPFEICKERDVKGLYKKAELGLIKGFTGVDDEYEIPNHPEITIDTTGYSPIECVDIIVKYLKKHKLIKS